MQKRFNTLLAPENRGGNLRPVSGASVTVTDSSGALATIYSDNGVTVAANPLTSNATGDYEYYAADGRYTETIVKAGRDTVTISDILLEDPADSPAPTSADMASTAANKGAGLVGFSVLVEYAVGTVGKWLVDLKAAAGSALVGFIQSGTGAVARTVQNKLRETVSVKDFGAVGDGVTNDKPAFLAAINAAIVAGGGEIYIPPGRYYMLNTGGSLPFGSNMLLHGAGMHNSVIVFDDGSGSRSDLFYQTSGDLVNAEFRNFGIESNCMTDFVQRSHLMEIHNVTGLHVSGVRFYGSRFMSLVAVACKNVRIEGCHFEKGLADGCNLASSSNVVVSNNTFVDICDDSISCHANDADTIVRSTVVIADNTITDSQGICVLGAKRVSITGNVITRPHTRAIVVDGETAFSQGNTATHSLVITGNVITDVFNGGAFAPGKSGSTAYYILVSSSPPTNGGSAPFVGGNKTSDGSVLSPLGYLELNNVDGAGKSAGSWFVNVSNNVCSRTLPLAAAYSDYGYGQRFARSGYSDIAITAAELDHSTSVGISLAGHLNNASINGNVISGLRRGVSGGTDGVAETAGLTAFSNIAVTGNVFNDFSEVGVYFGRKASGVIISGNTFNGDPYHRSSNRLANGKWVASIGAAQYPIGMFSDTSSGMSMIGNVFRNVYHIAYGGGQADYLMLNNVGYCDPANLNYDANNIGIAYVDIAHTYVIEEGDPTQAGYGKLKNMPITVQSSMPTSGKYVRPHFVRNSNPSTLGTAGSQYVIQGWQRKTVGSGHVLNTDWAELRCLTGT